MLHAERKVSWPDSSGRAGGTMRSRQVPTEPMYMMLNVDSSPKWGWPSHLNCEYEEEVLGCPKCCYDCKQVECTTCIETLEDGSQRNIRGWFANLCTMLSNGTAAYEIEHVRVYQDPDAINVGCDTPAYRAQRPLKPAIHGPSVYPGRKA